MQNTANLKSFRDPAGELWELDGRFIRFLREAEDSVLASPVLQSLISDGRFVEGRPLPPAEREALHARTGEGSSLSAAELRGAVEHPPIAFVSYPYEWPAVMLHAAAELTLDIAARLLPEGLTLKDATPYNVLFRGARPCFVDWLSVERRDPGSPLWQPLGQFMRTFLYPLLLHKHLSLSTGELLLSHRDGLRPADVFAVCPGGRRWLPPFLGAVSIPYLLERRAGASAAAQRPRPAIDADRAEFILGILFKGLGKRLHRLRPLTDRRSRWSEYAKELPSYNARQSDEKTAWLEATLRATRPRWVLDVGANTGNYSVMAQTYGASVVAIDSDEVAIARLWERAHAGKLDILPLVVDIGRPTPAVGWNNDEGSAFLDRARGRFDLVMFLAVIHHLRWGCGVTLPHQLSLIAGLTRRHAIIEYVDRDDPMFRALAAGRTADDWSIESFQRACAAHFRIVDRHELPGARRALFLLEK